MAIWLIGKAISNRYYFQTFLNMFWIAPKWFPYLFVCVSSIGTMLGPVLTFVQMLGPLWEYFGAILGSFIMLGPSRVRVGTIFSKFGANLGTILWGFRGHFGAIPGPFRDLLGQLLDKFETSLDNVGMIWDDLRIVSKTPRLYQNDLNQLIVK